MIVVTKVQVCMVELIIAGLRPTNIENPLSPPFAPDEHIPTLPTSSLNSIKMTSDEVLSMTAIVEPLEAGSTHSK